MTGNEFVWWLQGYLEANREVGLTSEQSLEILKIMGDIIDPITVPQYVYSISPEIYDPLNPPFVSPYRFTSCGSKETFNQAE